MHAPTVLRAATLAVALAFATAADAKTLRWSSQGDILTMDPHAQNEGLNNTVSDHIYEPLVTRGKDLKIEPCLAVSWKAVSPTAMQFKLRQGIKFHDGTPFTADDVVFSIERALAPTSNFSPYMQGITGARKVDDATVEITTKGPNPVLLPQLTIFRRFAFHTQPALFQQRHAWCDRDARVDADVCGPNDHGGVGEQIDHPELSRRKARQCEIGALAPPLVVAVLNLQRL